MLFRQLRRRRQLKQFYCALAALQRNIFACYLEEDYPEARHAYETRLRRAHHAVFAAMQVLRRIEGVVTHHSIINKLARLYEAVIALGQLRLRVSDRALFTVWRQELLAMTDVLGKIFQQRSCAPYVDMQSDLQALQYVKENLEDVYHGALRITAPEPLIFLFFIEDLTAVSDALTVLA